MDKDEFLKALAALKNVNNPAHIVGVGVTATILHEAGLIDHESTNENEKQAASEIPVVKKRI